jgi:hypothetical protein
MPADVMEEEISPHMQFTHSCARVFNVFNEGFRSMLFHIVIVLISFSFLFWFCASLLYFFYQITFQNGSLSKFVVRTSLSIQ